MRGLAAVLGAAALVAVLSTTGSAAPATTVVTTFTLTKSEVTSNPNANELTIDAAGQKASQHHCCDGGKWDIEYFWKVPTSFTTTSATFPATLGISSMTAVPVQPLLIQTTIRFPDFAQPFQLHYPDQTSGSKDFQIPIPAYLKGWKDPVQIVVGVVSAEVAYTYTPKTVSTSTPKTTCRKPAAADANGTHKVTWSFNVTGVPERGESPTLVGSTTAGRGTFTVCGDTSKSAWITGTGAEGTIVHVDRHAHLGRVVTDKLVLKVVGARVRVAHGLSAGDVTADLYVKVISSNDPQCKVGKLGSITANRTIPEANSSLDVSLCGADHSHGFPNSDPKVSAFVNVAVH